MNVHPLPLIGNVDISEQIVVATCGLFNKAVLQTFYIALQGGLDGCTSYHILPVGAEYRCMSSGGLLHVVYSIIELHSYIPTAFRSRIICHLARIIVGPGEKN